MIKNWERQYFPIPRLLFNLNIDSPVFFLLTLSKHRIPPITRSPINGRSGGLTKWRGKNLIQESDQGNLVNLVNKVGKFGIDEYSKCFASNLASSEKKSLFA